MILQHLPLLQIQKVIVHDVPKHNKSDFTRAVTYSQQESNITNELLLFFKDKIVNALTGDRAFKICVDQSATSPVPTILSEIITSTGQVFIPKTQEATKHIYNIQTGINSGGLMVYFLGDIKAKNVTVVLKLERDEGAQLKINNTTSTIDIVGVKDLMLTQKTKLFKVALLTARGHFNTDYDGVLMDYQMNASRSKIYADFFLYDFLGCCTYLDPRTTTKNFYDKTKEFIGAVEDQVVKAKYLQDLYSYLQKNTTTVNVKEFADDYLHTAKEKQDYNDFMKRNNIPLGQISKDLQYIQNNLKKITIDFENGISIIAKKGDINTKVKLEKLQDGRHKAEIVAKIKNVN